MPPYKVVFTIEVEAPSALEAAQEAKEWILDEPSIEWTWEVTNLSTATKEEVEA